MQQAIRRAGGWLPFDRFMALALYAPGLGYYANSARQFGQMPSSGSDFVTAPEMSPLFGQALAAQVAQALEVSGTDEVWEFGAGSGRAGAATAAGAGAAGAALHHRRPVGHLARAPAQRAGGLGGAASSGPANCRRPCAGWWWATRCSMPCRSSCWPARTGTGTSAGWCWPRRAAAESDVHGGPGWEDRLTDLRPPVEIAGDHDYLTEIHPQAEAFVRTLADRLEQGCAILHRLRFSRSRVLPSAAR